MPSVNWSGVSRAAGSTSTRTTAVLMSASLSAAGRRAMTTAPRATDLTVAAWPGTAPRLLRQGAEDYSDYVRDGGYPPLDDPDDLLDQVDRSRHARSRRRRVPARGEAADRPRRGPGGSETVVVANGEEGEPASVKDRWLLRAPPAPGARRAARRAAVGADGVRLRLRPRGRRSVADAVADLRRALSITGDRWSPATSPARRPPRCARSTGGPPSRPTSRRARSRRASAAFRPWCRTSRRSPICPSHRHGAEAYRAAAPTGSPGTFLATITGAGGRRRSTSCRTACRSRSAAAMQRCGSPTRPRVLMGGYFAGLLNRDVLDATLDHETMPRARQRPWLRRDHHPHRRLPGGRRGVGDGVLRPRERRPVRLVLQRHRRDVGRSPRLRDGVATNEDLARLERWSVVLRGPWRLRDAGRRDERRREPAPAVPAGRRPPPGRRLRLVPRRAAVSGGAALRGGGGRDGP